MTNELKKKIVTAALAYMQHHKLSQGEVVRQTGINAAYVSAILKGDTKVATTEIPDRWFMLLAEFVGIEVKKSYWKTIITPQFQVLLEALETAKKNGTTRLITGQSGFGKSFAISKFIRQNPLNTYWVIIADHYRLNDLINELLVLLNIDYSALGAMKHVSSNSKKSRIDAIINRLRDIKLQGGFPILIIDEAENMAIPLLKVLKALYDLLKDYCAIVLIGTEDVEYTLRTRKGMYPLYRRFVAGHRRLPAKIDYEPFLQPIADKELRKLLIDLSPNYGVLHDYLEPFLHECDEKGREPNCTNFCIKNNLTLPTQKRA